MGLVNYGTRRTLTSCMDTHRRIRFSTHDKPLVAVLLGGSNRNFTMADQEVKEFAEKLVQLKAKYGCRF